MKITTDGLVIREQSLREQDKIITILTRSNGVVRAFVHGAKNIKSPLSAASGLLTYSDVSVYFGKESNVIDEAHTRELFYPLRSDVEKLALAQYFCELLRELAPENEPAEDFLRLALNTLHFLCGDAHPTALLKGLFELRLLTLSGYMPDLIGCADCRRYEDEEMLFLPSGGTLLCGSCARKRSADLSFPAVHTGMGATAAMRHSVYSEFNKLYSFSLSENVLPAFTQAAEKYLLHSLGHGFKSLDFYSTLTQVT